MILVSRMTWRCRLRWAMRRKASTFCWSRLLARTTSRPACGLTTTLLPGSSPTIISTTLRTSAQKSTELVVVRRLALRVVELVLVVVSAPVLSVLSLLLTSPELTRVSVVPSRWIFR